MNLASDLGLLTLDRALLDLNAGVKETSHNAGPAVREYLAVYGLEPPANWCSVAASVWVKDAAKTAQIDPPVEGSPAALAFFAQLLRAGFGVRAGRPGFAESLRAGNLVFWTRPARASWAGHVGVIESGVSGGRFYCIEANSGPRGDRVARMHRSARDPLLFGVGLLRGIKGADSQAWSEPPNAGPPTLKSEDIAWIDEAMKLSREDYLSGPFDPLACGSAEPDDEREIG